MVWLLLLLLVAILFIYHPHIITFIKHYLDHKFGLEHINQINASFKQFQLVIYITGIQLRIKPLPSSSSSPVWIKKVVLYIISLRMTHVIVTCITKYIVIDIHHILLTKESLVLQIDHISIKNDQKLLFIQMEQLQLQNQQQSIGSIQSSRLRLSGLLESNVDIELQLGKSFVYCDQYMKLVSSTDSGTTSVSREVSFLNSMRVTIDCVDFVWAQLVESNIKDISITVRRHPTPFAQIAASQWTCSVSNTPVVSIPSIDITLAKSQHTFAPYTNFISVTWILNSPVVNIPLLSPVVSKLTSSNKNQTTQFEKTFTNLPLCTFALVFKSPKLQLHTAETTGFVTAESFIIRLSGEYVAKGREDIPSASSGSESHLDVLFAQEEYQWMRSKTGYQPVPSKWTQLMDRISRNPNQQGSYRMSAKCMMYKLKLGHVESISVEKQFLKMKHAVLIFKVRCKVAVNHDRYETRMSLDQGVQAEVSIDRPVVSLWNDADQVCSSVVWLSTIPACVAEISPGNSKAPPVWVSGLIRSSLNFSLEVSEGSIVVTSLDRAQSMEEVPSGYIDNTPKETVWTRLVLDTQKFNLVCQGAANTGTDWNIRCHLDTLYLQQLSGTHHLSEEKKEVIVWISQLNLGSKLSGSQDTRHVSVSCKVKKYGVCYSIQHHYVCLLFVRSLSRMKDRLGVDKKGGGRVHVDLDVQVSRGDIHLFLPNSNQLYHRIDDLSIERKSMVVIKFRNMMVLGQSPVHAASWEQLVEIDKAHISIKHHRQIDLKSRKIFASVPYSYTLSTVLDSVIGLIKAIKELQARLLTENAFTYFGPTCNNEPILIPCIQIKTHVLKINFDDDPFEAKLRTILRTGLVEQQKRLSYEEALQVKMQEMLVHDTSTQSIAEESSTVVESPDLSEVYAQIAEAKKNLLVHFSKLWIKNIKEQKRQEEMFYQEMHVSEDYRNSVTAEALDETLDEIQRPQSGSFSIEILPRPFYPALAHFSSQFTKISFKPADFALQETRQFIHTIGGGVPLNNNFSVIIPFHLSIKAGQTWIKVRDYPLPLLYVPPQTPTEDDASSSTRRSRNQSRVSWSLEGNYALGDELGGSCGSRIIDIPIIPGLGSLGYTLSAVRTTSPVKFYSVVDYHILTSSLSTICWSMSYSPAIQDIMRVLESLSAEQVDPSSRLGFWDKVRFMIHTQTKLSFIGGGDLALVVKGTRDPYQLQGRGAGLTKIWSQDVVWLLGYKNPQHEFMQIVSKQYAFGVPDLVRGGFVPSLPDSYERKSSAVPDDPNRFLKVVLKLTDGIRMGIGLGFERLGCNRCAKCVDVHHLNRCRSQDFSPHYNVLFQSVKQVETFYDKDTYDAFHGFRSDFVHLSLSIIKLHQPIPDSDSTSQNAMYISPCFIEHFSHWYGLLGSPISIPVRQGTLFPHDQEKSKSFGEHLNTVKYKFVINPLAIGFFCTDEESYMHVKGGGSAGLKALVSQFSVDLHQRRELNPVDASLKAEMSFHELEIELHGIDLRVIKASQSASVEEEVLDGFQWVDPRDYVILDSVSYAHQNHIPYKKIGVHPFAFSPLFYYVRQNDEGSTASRDYLRQTHDCIMGKGTDSHEFQKSHLQKRATDLDNTIEEYDKQLDIVLNAMHTMHPYEKEVSDQHAILIEKINYLRTNRYMLHTYIAQLILETELNASGRDSPQTTTSSIGRRNELCRWETLMGHFQDRFFIHNPQIIWNNSVRDAIYYWQEIKDHRSVQVYNLSSRCFKFLQDLVHTAEKQQQWKPDVPVATSRPLTEEEPENMTQKLIDKLLAERIYNFVAYNEKEENKSKAQQPSNEYEGIHVFESSTDNVDDPDYQYKNIPDSYEMKSKYLIDMINPQVNFQSDKGLDHLILFTNERIHVKAFSIIDNSSSGAADKDVRLVKDRIIVALDNAQLLVAKRMEFLACDLLTQSAYGQCRNLHWASWIQPEQLWYYKDVKYFDNFQRVASQLCGTIQLDRYNHLRIKINKYNTSRKSPFEDRTNTMQLHFPQFKLTLNSQQAHILYYTLINLLLGNSGSPRKKERLNRFRDVMLAAERSDLAETVKQVGVLQNRSRVLLELHQRFMQALPRLDSLGVREFNRNKKKMRQNLEKLYLVVEAIRCIQTFRRDIHLEETDNAMRFSFTSDEIVWEAVLDDANQSSLCKWILTSTKFVFFNKQNGSSKSTIEVGRMQLKNTTDEPVFTNVLDAYMEPGQAADYSRQKMLRGVLESLPPVGGIPVIQQLEINLVPLHLQISTAFGTAMKDYFFPRIVAEENTTVETDETESEESEEEYDDDEDVVSLVDGLEVTSRNSSKFDNRSLSNSVDKTFNSTLSKREGSFASFDLITKKVKETVRRKKSMKSDELTVMKNRSSTNRTFIYIRIPATKHCLSLRGPTQNTFYNLYNFPFKQPKLEYRNTTWSIAEMMEEIQKQFLRAALRHSPALLKNKLMSNNKQPTLSISTTNRSIQSGVSIDTTTRAVVRPPITSHSSYNTEEEDFDIKSLHSNDPEEELERLVEQQVVNKRISLNVDQELLDFYMNKYKQEEEVEENVHKGRMLFGESYNGIYHPTTEL